MPLAILEWHIPSQIDPLYKVICHAEACTTGFNTSHLPEPKAAWVVWAVSLSIETTQLINMSCLFSPLFSSLPFPFPFPLEVDPLCLQNHTRPPQHPYNI